MYQKGDETRGARRRARTRADLLAAARQVFVARGYHDASIAEITAAADIGVGTFYLHFRDKEDVLRVVLDEGRETLRAEISEALAAAPPEQRLPLLIRTIFACAYRHRDLFSLVLTGGKSVGAGVRARADIAEVLAGALEPAAAAGLLPGYDVPLLARLLSGILTQGIMWWFEHDTPDPDTMTTQVLRLLREGLPAPLLADPKGRA